MENKKQDQNKNITSFVNAIIKASNRKKALEKLSISTTDAKNRIVKLQVLIRDLAPTSEKTNLIDNNKNNELKKKYQEEIDILREYIQKMANK